MNAKFGSSKQMPPNESTGRNGATISVVKTEREIGLIATLEAEIFSGHEPASLSEIRAIHSRGELLLLRNNGHAIGEAQILYGRVDGLGRLEKVLPEKAAFIEGIGLAKVARGGGMQLLLIDECHNRARMHSKERIYSSVREGNGASLRQFLKSGYYVVGLDPIFYGSRSSHARMILEHNLCDGNSSYADTRLCENSKQARVIHAGDLVGVYIRNGQRPDAEARLLIRRFLENGYVGINLYRSGVCQKNVLIMKLLSSFETRTAARLRSSVARLRQIYIQLSTTLPHSGLHPCAGTAERPRNPT